MIIGSPQGLASIGCDILSPTRENSGCYRPERNTPTFELTSQAEPRVEPGFNQTHVMYQTAAPMAVQNSSMGVEARQGNFRLQLYPSYDLTLIIAYLQGLFAFTILLAHQPICTCCHEV